MQQTWQNVTLRRAGTFAPNQAGWDVSALPSFTQVEGSITPLPADLNDATLTIEVDLEFTNDADGSSGWAILTGQLWQGGPAGRDHHAQVDPITVGPYQTTRWPPLKRLRFHVTPSRDVASVDGQVTGT
jgi:hypothetical protein